ncbi:MAG: hypothetical protein HZB13_05875 [Acidobacteria bacterium]|nr:hypothetical protein [Acidobacteriota bacterium]
MQQIFNALPGIIVRALPTFFLVILLHWYLKKVLFQPMERVLAERRRRTQGAVEASEAAIAQVNQKLADYENRLAEARAAIYHQQEASHKKLLDRQAALIAEARNTNAEAVAQARAVIAAEADAAKTSLESQAGLLAGQITDAIFAGGAN